jgi:hypothetical protein
VLFLTSHDFFAVKVLKSCVVCADQYPGRSWNRSPREHLDEEGERGRDARHRNGQGALHDPYISGSCSQDVGLIGRTVGRPQDSGSCIIFEGGQWTIDQCRLCCSRWAVLWARCESEVSIKNCFMGGMEDAPGYCVNCQDHARVTVDGCHMEVMPVSRYRSRAFAHRAMQKTPSRSWSIWGRMRMLTR